MATPAATTDMPSFQIVAHADGTLDIEGTIPASSLPANRRIGVDSDAADGVKDALVWRGGLWEKLPPAPEGPDFVLPPCGPAPCRVRYRFALGDLAREQHDPEIASGKDGAYLSVSTAWLLLPDTGSVPAHRFHVQMDSAAGAFASGADPGPNAGDYVQTATDLAAPFSTFGYRVQSFAVGRAKFDVAIGPGKMLLSDDVLADLIKRTAVRIAEYDGVFPAPHTLVILAPSARGHHDDGNGLTLGGGGASVLLHISRDADEARIEHEWVPTHEMLHVAFPSIGPPHRWMEEGLSTYLEPVVRGRAGTIDQKNFWTDLVQGLPQGEPMSGDAGLNSTGGWASTYWGGALFWFSVDLGIRRRTGGKKSLRDALHAIAAEGGFTGQHWPVERVLDVGDRGAGVPVLHERYAAMALEAGAVDLAATWTSLGIAVGPRGITFDAHAPEAAFCQSMFHGDP